MNWYLQVLKNYAGFSGRARRKEYWMFALFNLIFLIVAMVLDNVLGTTIEDLPYGLFYFLYALVVLIPSLAVAVRRLHDVGKSGWVILISLIPIVGAIWLLVLMFTDSNPGENKYGVNPKDAQTDDLMVDESTGDKLILIAVIFMFLHQAFWIITNIVDGFYQTATFEVINIFFVLIWALIPLSLAFAVKNKSKQIILFILGGLYLLYGLYETITQLI